MKIILKKPSNEAQPKFIITLCQPGLEIEIKKEWLKRYPHLHPSFSKNGLCTWKILKPFFKNTSELQSTLASEILWSDGEIDKIKTDLNQYETYGIRLGEKPSPLAHYLGPRVRQQNSNNTIYQVFEYQDGKYWVGHNQIKHLKSSVCGGVYSALTHARAPSRAYAKWLEAIDLLKEKQPLQEGDIAIEWGAAPGGGTLSLLEQGVTVFAVDPSPNLWRKAIEEPNEKYERLYYNFEMSAEHFLKRMHKFPKSYRATHFFCDINLSPEIIFPWFQKLSAEVDFKALIITLKLSNWNKLSKIDLYQDQIKNMGFANTWIKHLWCNRQEITLFATK